jgi:hypothetical protein
VSDNNIIRPRQWLANAESSLAAPLSEPLPPDASIVGGGGGPMIRVWKLGWPQSRATSVI